MVSDKVATNKARLVAYCEHDVKERLEQLAEIRLRSLSNLIESVLVDELAKAEKSGELPEKQQKDDRHE